MEVAHKEDHTMVGQTKKTGCEAKNEIYAGAKRSRQLHYAMDLKCVAKRFHFGEHWNREKKAVKVKIISSTSTRRDGRVCCCCCCFVELNE